MLKRFILWLFHLKINLSLRGYKVKINKKDKFQAIHFDYGKYFNEWDATIYIHYDNKEMKRIEYTNLKEAYYDFLILKNYLNL